MPDQLLAVKLYTPPLRPGQVDRARLLEKLNQGLEQGHRLTLVSAPAGYGKTTLIIPWTLSLGRKVTWLSLERSDNHLVQFLAYLIAALQQVDAGIGLTLQAALENTNRPEGEMGADGLLSQLPSLMNDIAAVPVPFVLVLDDYHAITDLAIHEVLGLFLEHQPAQMHLVIITRQDPLLRLSRQRSQGQVTEIRLGDLRFTDSEAAAFLNETMKLGLTPEQVTSLVTRTEGWIAGLATGCHLPLRDDLPLVRQHPACSSALTSFAPLQGMTGTWSTI